MSPFYRRTKPIEDHVSSRWEGLPLTSDGQTVLETDDGQSILSDESSEDEPKTIRGKIAKLIKILIPHVILISMLLGYLSLGAFILISLESEKEIDKTRRKIERLVEVHAEFANESWALRNELTYEDWWKWMHEQLSDKIAVAHDERFQRQMAIYERETLVETRWTFPTALLYALTVLTTCGYGEVGVYTPKGQIFAVGFALVGIPLMFITAADIGKFLSESLMKALDCVKTTIKSIKHFYRRLKARARRRHLSGDDDIGDDDSPLVQHEAVQKLWFPIITYVSVISAYCCMGAVMFRTWEETWPFIHAFHFGFNLIVTVGLGELVVTDPIFLCLIVAFVIIGLSVVTMCVDLASTHLKAYFTQLHYFGRAKAFLDMGDDIRNMMEYLAWMRKKKGGNVTWQDVADLLEQIKRGPYDPSEAIRMKWIDETSSQVSTIRGSYGGSKSNLSLSRKYSIRNSKDLTPFIEEPLTPIDDDVELPSTDDNVSSSQLLRPPERSSKKRHATTNDARRNQPQPPQIL